MATKTNLYPETLGIRLPKGTTAKLKRKAKVHNCSHSGLLREFIEAFLDDRLTIKPDPKKQELYK